MIILTLMLALLLSPVSTNGASPRAAHDATVAPFEIEGVAVNAIVVEPVSGEARYASAGQTLYRAGEDGMWSVSGTAPGRAVMVADSRNPDVIWAGIGQECYRGGGETQSMVQSPDGGATWADKGTQGLVPLASWVDTGMVIAHDCSGLQVSHDGGATWAMPEGLPLGSQITAFTVASSPESSAGLTVLVGTTGEGGTSELYRVSLSDPAAITVDGPLQTYYAVGALSVEDNGAILLAAPQGVLRSDDRGKTWTTIRDGLESTTLAHDPIESFPTDVEPGSFGLRSLLTVGDVTYVSGVDGIYQRGAGEEEWQRVAALDTEVELLAVELGSDALLARPVDGALLHISIQ